MIPRFQLPDPPPRDSQIIACATGLKIELWKDRDGDIHGEAEIHCGFGMFGDEEEDFDGDKQELALRFVRELMREFTRRHEA